MRFIKSDLSYSSEHIFNIKPYLFFIMYFFFFFFFFFFLGGGGGGGGGGMTKIDVYFGGYLTQNLVFRKKIRCVYF